jgi:hypothetical protein
MFGLAPFGLPFSGPSNFYFVNASEAATAADSIVSTASFLASAAESLDAIDAYDNIGVFLVSISEPGTATDDYLGGLLYLASIAEAATALDAIAQRLKWEPEPAASDTWTVISGNSNP